MHHQDTVPPDAGSERLVADRYRLLSTLGEGGMGTVWRARDEVLRREVAIKEVRAPSGMSAEKIQRMYTRLEREAWAAARITARNVITVHDVVTDGGRPWIVMELVRGRSLAELLRTQGSLTPQEAARIGAEVLVALRAAHDADVLHRDVKPANVLLADDDRVILTDFGIAMVQGDTALTMTGEVVGSPEYLAPEQALGRPLGPATDLWSLGVLLHTAVQGRSPFRQDSTLGTLRAVVDEQPPFPDRAGPLASVIDGLLRKDPAERASAERTARDLRLVAAGAAPDADSTATGASPTAAATATARTGAPAPFPSADTATDITVDAPTGQAYPATQAPPTDTTESTDATDATDTADSAGITRTGTAPTAAVPARTGDVRPAVASPSADTATAPTAVTPDAPTGGTPTAPAPVPPDRGRRTGYLLVALATVSVLLLGGLGYALTRNGDEDGADAKDPASNAANTASPSQQEQQQDQQDQQQAQPPVTVSVEGTNTTYSGSCPPPQEQAPAFTATFEVTELPVRFTYRWVSAEGEVVDRAWRTLSFSEGGPRTHRQTIRVTTYAQAGTLAGAMGVEIKSSRQTISDTVPFTLTCE